MAPEPRERGRGLGIALVFLGLGALLVGLAWELFKFFLQMWPTAEGFLLAGVGYLLFGCGLWAAYPRAFWMVLPGMLLLVVVLLLLYAAS